jgi:hypothetical protein
METSARELLGVSAYPAATTRVEPKAFVPREPSRDEISEPEYEPRAEVNRGRIVYRIAKGDRLTHLFFGAMPGFFVGWLGVFLVSRDASNTTAAVAALICAIAGGTILLVRSNGLVCSDCRTSASAESAVCTGCGGILDRRVSERELQLMREEELERLAATEESYYECDACAPEEPCDKHAVG